MVTADRFACVSSLEVHICLSALICGLADKLFSDHLCYLWDPLGELSLQVSSCLFIY